MNIIQLFISLTQHFDRFGCISKIMVDSLIVGIVHHLTAKDVEAAVEHVENGEEKENDNCKDNIGYDAN